MRYLILALALTSCAPFTADCSLDSCLCGMENTDYDAVIICVGYSGATPHAQAIGITQTKEDWLHYYGRPKPSAKDNFIVEQCFPWKTYLNRRYKQ